MISDLKAKISKFSFQDWFFVVFSLLWVSIIMMDYFNKQIVYGPSFRFFRYTILFLGLSAVGVLFSLYANKLFFFAKAKKVYINGLVILILIIGTVWAITFAFNQYWTAPLDFTNYLHMAGKAIYTLGCSLLLVVGSYGLGNLLRRQLLPSGDRSLTFVLLDITIGFIAYTFIMMILGAFALLNQVLLLGSIAAMALSDYKSSWWLINKTLWDPITRPKDLTFWGGLLAFFILVYLSMNYLYTQSPFPLGFDARNYYVNICKLIAEAEALVPGFQPYAWGLVMSTGYIAFDSPEITMFISTLGGILTLFAIYDMCTRYLNISSTLSLLAVLLFLVSPTVTNHWMIEFKIDLALLFIQMVTLNIFLWWCFEKEDPITTTLSKNKLDRNLAITIGILFGYALSVKILSVFLVIAIFVAIWFYHKDLFGMLGFAALSIGAILVIGLDSLSGLRDYHLSPGVTGAVFGGLGIVALTYSLIKTRTKFIKSIIPIIISGIMMTLVFSPWVYKNYVYLIDKNLTPLNLITGQKPRPPLTDNAMMTKYNRYKKAQQKEQN